MALSKPVRQIIEETTNPLLVKHDAWGRIPIGEIAKIDNGFAFKSEAFNTQGEGTPLIRIRDVTRGETETYYDGDYDEAFIVNHGDLLVGMDGDFNSARWTGRPALLNQRVCRIRLLSDLYDEGFLTHSLQPYLDEINKETSSVTVKHLSSKTVSEIPLPFPPLPEQRRIVARIEELFSRLDAGVAALRHAKAQLQRYRQSVLAAAVTGELTREWREQHGIKLEDWRQTTLGDESSLVTSGSRGWAKYYSDDGPLFVRAQNIKTDALVLDDLAHVRPPVGSEGARTQVFENDLLITITGANVTKSALVKQPLGEAYVSQHVALVRPVNSDHAPFLYYAIISPGNGRAFLEEKAYGAGKPGLNLTNVREVPIRVPPLAEQHQIVAEVDARSTAIGHLEAELNRQITRSNRLRQSALAAAFSGHLVN